VLVDARNQLWIGTENAGLVRMSADRRQLHFYDRSSQPLMGTNTVWSLASTPDGSIWFGTHEGGLYRLDSQDRLQRFLPEPNNPRSLPSSSVPYLATLADGSLWIGTKHGVARWTGTDFERVGTDHSQPADQRADRRARWQPVDQHDGRGHRAPPGWPLRGTAVEAAARRAGAGHDAARRAGRALAGYAHRAGTCGRWPVPDRAAVQRDRTRPVRPNWTGAYEDREGGIWLASTNAGLWHLLPRWWQFSVLSRLEDDPSSLRNALVLGTSPSSNGGVWTVGSHGALDRFDPKTGRIEQHRTWVNGMHWLTSVREDRRPGLDRIDRCAAALRPASGANCVAGAVMPVPMRRWKGSSKR
jgi:ligand-binding sensor domain-containing protein